MSELQPVTLTFGGQDYTVDTDDGIWGLIEAVESVVTFIKVAQYIEARDYPSALIFRAYAVALTYAGRKTTPLEVKNSADMAKLGEYLGAIGAILSLGQPSFELDIDPTTDPAPKKKSAKKKQ